MRVPTRLLGERYGGEANCGLFNVEGLYDDLLSFLDHASDEHLLPSRRSVLMVEKELDQLLSKLCV